jgi:hypothetical protein
MVRENLRFKQNLKKFNLENFFVNIKKLVMSRKIDPWKTSNLTRS